MLFQGLVGVKRVKYERNLSLNVQNTWMTICIILHVSSGTGHAIIYNIFFFDDTARKKSLCVNANYECPSSSAFHATSVSIFALMSYLVFC